MLAKRILQIQPSVTLQISQKVQQMRQEGKNVIGFGAGEPDLATPEFVCLAAQKAMEAGKTHYTPVAGIPELRNELCHWLKRHFQLQYSPAEVLVSAGAKHSLFNLMAVLLNEGDEVALPTPFWVSYPEQVRLLGGVVCEIPTSPETGWKVTPEQLRSTLGEKTKLLLLNTPSNPTGVVYSREELVALLEVLRDFPQVYLVSDEIYGHLTYGISHVSPLALAPWLRERAIWVGGVSKSYAMTGWRIGFAVGPQEVIQGAAKVQSHTTSNACSIAQYAALAALEQGDEVLEEYREVFFKRRQLMESLLREYELSFVPPQGAFYFFVSVHPFLEQQWRGEPLATSLRFCQALLEEAEVAAVPGEAFGPSGQGYLRLSYAVSEEKIREGVHRLGQFCNRLAAK